MYPSIQLRYGLSTRKDSEQFYLQVLYYLTEERLALKTKKKAATSEEERLRFDAMQNAFKILINGGYGFSGTGGYGYNCMATAALVTAYGRVLITHMVEAVEASGATIIEVDTDGFIFEAESPQDVCDSVQDGLPEGINIGLDWQGYAAFVPKRKNYLLIDPQGNVKRVGLFRKRNRSQFEREFPVSYLIRWLHDPHEAEQFYQQVHSQLERGEYPVDRLMVTQRIPSNSKALLVLGKPGEVISYYWGEDKRYGARGRRLKSIKCPVQSGPYYGDHYVKQLEEMYKEIQELL